MNDKVLFTETILRDGQQSQLATRMTTDEIIPIVSTMDKVGYHALEVWGGATFDTCLRYLNEDPWERLRKIRKEARHTKLQMLLRGQNLLGYKNYPDDVVEEFIRLSIKNGIDIIRIFDALNDVRNLKTSIDAIKKWGGHCQVAIAYTTSEFHNVEYFVDLAKQFSDLGADSICIKDMAGILLPNTAFQLVTKIKQEVSLPLEIHTHATAGVSEMTYLKSVEAGADIIDTCLSPLSGGTSQPATESIALSYKNMGIKTGIQFNEMELASQYFDKIRDDYRANGILDPKVKDTMPKALLYQVPGGMISNLISQLKEQGLESKFDDVVREVPKVRADFGFPPLVTPLSQMVGTQALMNVISGERYKIIPNEVKDYVRGLYGRSPVEISDEIRNKIIGDEEVVTVRPADLLEPQLKKMEKKIRKYAKSAEDVMMYGLFPQQATDFLGRREDPFYDVPIQNIEVILE